MNLHRFLARALSITAAILLSSCATEGKKVTVEKEEHRPTGKQNKSTKSAKETETVKVLHIDRVNSSTAAPYVGGLAAADVSAYMRKQQRELESQLASDVMAGKILISRSTDHALKVHLSSDTAFVNESAELRPEIKSNMLGLAQSIGQYDQSIVHILSFTSSIGSARSNKVRSQRQAHEIARYFEHYGVSKDRILAIGYGELYPVASNRSQEGQDKNQRLEIHLRPIVRGREQNAYTSPPLPGTASQLREAGRTLQ